MLPRWSATWSIAAFNTVAEGSIFEQPLAGQVLTRPNDLGEPTVVDLHVEVVSRFPAELEMDATAPDVHLLVSQRRQTERAIASCVLNVADPQTGDIEQSHNDRDNAMMAEVSPSQITVDTAAQRSI